MAISYDSIGQECVTVRSSNHISVGAPCKFTTSNFVSACSDGNAFHGIVMSQNDDFITLAVHGFVTVPYSGTAPTVGYCPLAAAAAGKVKKLEGAKEHLVVSVDTTMSTVTFLL